MLLFNKPGYVGSNFDVIVGMPNHDQDVDFVTGVWLRIGLGLLSLRGKDG